VDAWAVAAPGLGEMVDSAAGELHSLLDVSLALGERVRVRVRRMRPSAALLHSCAALRALRLDIPRDGARVQPVLSHGRERRAQHDSFCLLQRLARGRAAACALCKLTGNVAGSAVFATLYAKLAAHALGNKATPTTGRLPARAAVPPLPSAPAALTEVLTPAREACF
jgi:hypothetical protein